MSLRFRRFPFAVALVAIACAALVVSTPAASPERVIAALLLALALPGIALIELLPGAERGWTGAVLLALGVSIAVLVLDSGLIYILGVPLDLASWGWSLAAITAGSAVASSVCRRPEPHGARHPVPAGRRPALGRPGAAVGGLAGACVAGLLVATVLITAHSVTQRSSADHFTQLWALPSTTTTGQITVGLYNHQGRAHTYLLTVRRSGKLLRDRTVALHSGGRWTATLSKLPAGVIRISTTSNRPGRVHRRVKLWLGGSGSSLTRQFPLGGRHLCCGRSGSARGSGSGSSLTRQFPLGGRHLCCGRSGSARGAAAGASTRAPRRAPAAPVPHVRLSSPRAGGSAPGGSIARGQRSPSRAALAPAGSEAATQGGRTAGG